MKWWKRVALRVPVAIALVAILMLGLATYSFLFITYVIEQEADNIEVMEPGRERIAAISLNVSGLNSRLLGVMAEVYSASGIVEPMNRHFGAIEQNLATLLPLLTEQISETTKVELQKSIANLVALREPLTATLRSNRRVSQAYDTWLDPFAAVNKSLLAVNTQFAEHVRQQAAESRVAADQAKTFIMVAAAVSVLLLSWVSYVLIFNVTRPIAFTDATMRGLSQGNFDVVIPYLERQDEIGAMARSVEVFRESGVEKSRLEKQAEEQRREADRNRAEREARENTAAQEISKLVGEIARGQLSNRIEEAGKEGFQLTVSQLLNTLTATLQRVTSEIDSVISALAEGDVSKTIEGDYEGVYGNLKSRTNVMAARLQEFAGRLAASSQVLRDASTNISEGSEELAGRTQSQAAMLEQTSASMQEISANVKKNAENAQEAFQLTTNSRAVVDRSGGVVNEAIAAMTQIQEGANKISEIISMIDEIAFQTNLLALNAAVEAARAGEAGKGFAVVAQEVRSLAQRSAEASKEIKNLISSSNVEVRHGSELVNSTGQSFSEIGKGIHSLLEIVSKISHASSEQAASLQEVNGAISNIDQMTQGNSELVDETHASAQALAEQASELNDLVGFFKLSDEGAEPSTSSPHRPRGDTSRVGRGRLLGAAS